MLALQDRAANRRDRMDRQGQPLGWAAWPPASASHFQDGDDSAPLAALAGDALAARFRSWRGASGRRYVFSLYRPPDCPPYGDAVMIVATVSAAGERTAVFIADTGCFPEIVLTNAAEKWMKLEARLEFHIHLLANSAAERRALIADLSYAPRS
jgi:hypothetical protein